MAGLDIKKKNNTEYLQKDFALRLEYSNYLSTITYDEKERTYL